MKTVLRIGDHGEEVKKLQALLNGKLKLSPNLKEDGSFGGYTERAVKQFQATNNLGIDGVAGPKTWSVLLGKAKPIATKSAVVPTNIATPWLDVAKKELNQKEIIGPEHNPRIVAYHATTTLKANNDETPWCSSFVNWCLKQAGIKGTDSATAISWLSWGKPTSAKSGAIIVIYNTNAANSSLTSSGNHVGFLVQETATHYQILGGNQSNKVKISSYPKTAWSLKGYRWPSQ